MAGMLPGVEAARRRKCHQSSESLPWTTSYGGFSMRRSSLTSASFMRKYPAKQALFDESELGGEAREAKKRLDARLQHRWKSQSKSLMMMKVDLLLRALEAKPFLYLHTTSPCMKYRTKSEKVDIVVSLNVDTNSTG
ncbi:uncharacterized protein LOC142546180 isoform X5 [Primulina tabacum]|uniref:uncharacterized protein LOC142546180 isoform X5 n=1 Tax=Primulina tabacum TaxID=48773 RepID=UPI003F59E450